MQHREENKKKKKNSKSNSKYIIQEIDFDVNQEHNQLPDYADVTKTKLALGPKRLLWGSRSDLRRYEI